MSPNMTMGTTRAWPPTSWATPMPASHSLVRLSLSSGPGHGEGFMKKGGKGVKGLEASQGGWRAVILGWSDNQAGKKENLSDGTELHLTGWT